MGFAAAGRRPRRPARRSAVLKGGQRALLRIRGSGLEQAARLCDAGRPCRQISAVLLGYGVSSHSGRYSLPERDGERAAMDQRALQQRLSRRARAAPRGAATLIRLAPAAATFALVALVAKFDHEDPEEAKLAKRAR